MKQREFKFPPTHIEDFDLGVIRAGHEVSIVFIKHFDPLLIFFKLGGIEGLGKEIFEQNRTRQADGAQVAHGPAHHSIAEHLIAEEIDVPDLDLRSFSHFKGDFQGRRRHLA